MIVVTAGTAEYRPIVEAQARKCRELGYAHHVYDLGGLGIGERYDVPESDLKPTVNGDSLPPATFKAALVMRHLKTATPNEFVCWMDADCLPLLPFSPFRMLPDPVPCFDMAVTLRPEPEVGACGIPAMDYLNSGIVWFRNTALGRDLCRVWQFMSVHEKTDQGALNEIVAPSFGKTEWESHRGKIFNGVLILDAVEWNSWHPPFTGARIAHFKRGIRGLAKDYL